MKGNGLSSKDNPTNNVWCIRHRACLFGKCAQTVCQPLWVFVQKTSLFF